MTRWSITAEDLNSDNTVVFEGQDGRDVTSMLVFNNGVLLTMDSQIKSNDYSIVYYHPTIFGIKFRNAQKNDIFTIVGDLL